VHKDAYKRRERMMDRTSSFGYWLRRRRKALDLTQENLAQQVGCSVETIKKIETDVRRPSRPMAERLAECLALPIEERTAFLKAARAELATDRLVVADQPINSVAQDLDVPHAPPATPLPSGTVTFLFTDIEGSTKLWEQHPQAMSATLVRHDSILRQQIAAHDGQVFKTVGDAVCAAFTRTSGALAAALAIQRMLEAEQWNATGPLRVRIALHTGVAEARADDYFGPPLNRVARLLAAGHGGQILLSLATEELVREHLPTDTRLRDLGRHRLRDLTHPEQIFQLVASDLPADFPPLRALETRVSNLPVQPNALIGRQREVAALLELLRRVDVRLVTLTGPGGMGKTRLATALTEQLLAIDRFADGVCFVALAPLTAPEQIVPALADALSFPLDTGKQRAHSPRQQVLDYLREKRLLLVLDNVEQLLDEADAGDEAGSLVAALLDAAPHLAILATSRERLKLREEHIYPLGGLAVPGGEASRSSDAVELFVQRARLLRPDYAPTIDDLGVVARICCLVDGMPLAIELAAGWVDTLALPDIALEIEHGLDLLATELRDVPARHRSMRAVFEASWRRLGAMERAAFTRLSVFRGGGARRAVQEVTGATLPQLQALLGASLLHYDAGRDRYTVHELLRQYAAEQLSTDPADERATRERHAANYCALLDHQRADLHGARQPEALSAIEADGENVRAAWEWAAGQRNAALIDQAIDSLGCFYEWQGRAEEGAAAYHLAATALVAASAPEAQRVRAKLLAWQGRYAYLLGDTSAAGALVEQSREVLERPDLSDTDTRVERAFVLLQVGRLAAEQDYPAARAAYKQSRSLYQALGDRWGEATALSGLGNMTFEYACDYDLAQGYLEESLALRQALHDRLGVVEALADLSSNARRLGRVGESERLARQSYELSIGIGNRRLIALAGGNLGVTLIWSRKLDEAYHMLQEPAAIYTDLGDRLGLMDTSYRLGLVQSHLGRYAEARAAFEEGRRIAQAVGSIFNSSEMLTGLMYGALAEGAYPDVLRLVAEAIPLCTTLGHRWNLSFTHTIGALAERGAGNRQQARPHVVAALRMALETHGWIRMIQALWGAALLLADDGVVERATELYTLAQREYPGGDPWRAAVYQRELAAVAAALPAEAAAAAQERGQARDLWATARELLADLEAAGWGAAADA
jgi:predicted ATPase/class 3 adenylate cyclase